MLTKRNDSTQQSSSVHCKEQSHLRNLRDVCTLHSGITTRLYFQEYVAIGPLQI